MRLRSFAIAMAIVFIVSAATIAQAAQNRPANKPRHEMFQRFSKAVGLTPDQAQKIKPIVEKFRADMKQIRTSNLPDQQKWNQIMQLRKQERDQIKGILTPDQQTKAKIFWAKERKHKAQWLAKQLGLTDTQKTTIKSMIRSTREQAKAIKADKSLDATARKAKLKALHKETKDKILAVLTPEQRTKLEQLKKSRHQQA